MTDMVIKNEITPCKRDFIVLNTLNQSNRNLLKKNSIYADNEEENCNLKYYKLGKSAQNIFKDH